MVSIYNYKDLAARFGCNEHYWAHHRKRLCRIGLVRKLGHGFFVDLERLGLYLAGGPISGDLPDMSSLDREMARIESLTYELGNITPEDTLLVAAEIRESVKTLQALKQDLVRWARAG